MPMTNGQANKIVNESVRPLAEKLRALEVEIESVLGTLSGPDPSDFFDYVGEGAGSTYEDLRGDEVPKLANANTIFMFRSRLIALNDAMDVAGFMDEINHLSVRPLRVDS